MLSEQILKDEIEDNELQRRFNYIYHQLDKVNARLYKIDMTNQVANLKEDVKKLKEVVEQNTFDLGERDGFEE